MVITDEDSRESIAEALCHVCQHAKRQVKVLGWEAPTPWDMAHKELDALITDYWAHAPAARA